MTLALANSLDLTRRWLTALLRQPWWVAITLVQPVIWLALFGSLFERVVEIPGFAVGSYEDFLAPGIVVMTALFSAGWNGMGMLNDLDRGVLDRFLVSPVARAALIVGPIAQVAIIVCVQSLIIVGLSLVLGATFPGGAVGVAALIGLAVLLAAAVAGVSNAIALTARREETLIGAVNFLILPLTFLSSTFMQLNLAPGWIEAAARFNPVNWAVEAGREAVAASPDWTFVVERAGLLIVLAVLAVWLATRAFRSYERSV
jgi:ABC-2 type transport system permease protein